MAQKIIEDIARQMRMLDESRKADDRRYRHAQARKALFESKQLENADTDIIDGASLGFVNGNDCSEECNTGFYDAFDEGDRSMEEDVSECCCEPCCCDGCYDDNDIATLALCQSPCATADEYAMLLQKSFPAANVKLCDLPDDAQVEIRLTGKIKDLKDAFAMKCGERCWSNLSESKKKEFDYNVQFADGTTPQSLKEREQTITSADKNVLDTLGLHPSTANLVAKNTAVMSLLEKEKLRRARAKLKMCMEAGDFSSLTDDQLDALTKAQNDTADDEEDIENMSAEEVQKRFGTPEKTPEEKDAEDLRLYHKAIEQDTGYTWQEFEALPQEEQDRIWKICNDRMYNKKTHQLDEPMTQKVWNIGRNWKDGAVDSSTVDVAVNMDYDKEHSPLQQRLKYKKIQGAEAEKEARQRLNQLATDIADDYDEAGDIASLDTVQWNVIWSALSKEEREQLFNELIDDAKEYYKNAPEYKDDPKAAEMAFAGEKVILKMLCRKYKDSYGKYSWGTQKDFGDMLHGVPTDNDMAAAMGLKTNVYQSLKAAIMYAYSLAILHATDAATEEEGCEILAENPQLYPKFIDKFNEIMNSRRVRSNPADPDRARAALAWRKKQKEASRKRKPKVKDASNAEDTAEDAADDTAEQ